MRARGCIDILKVSNTPQTAGASGVSEMRSTVGWSTLAGSGARASAGSPGLARLVWLGMVGQAALSGQPAIRARKGRRRPGGGERLHPPSCPLASIASTRARRPFARHAFTPATAQHSRWHPRWHSPIPSTRRNSTYINPSRTPPTAPIQPRECHACGEHLHTAHCTLHTTHCLNSRYGLYLRRQPFQRSPSPSRGSAIARIIIPPVAAGAPSPSICRRQPTLRVLLPA